MYIMFLGTIIDKKNKFVTQYKACNSQGKHYWNQITLTQFKIIKQKLV